MHSEHSKPNPILATIVMLAAPLAQHRQKNDDDVVRALVDHVSEARQSVVEARQLAALGGIDGQAVSLAEGRLAAAVDSVVLYTRSK